MINHALIEAMVAPGLSRKAEFNWGAVANDLKTIVGHLASGQPALPPMSGVNENLNSEIGLAFAVAHVWDKSKRSAWPDTALRRVATIAMQMGGEMAELADFLPHTSDYMNAYLQTVLEREANSPDLQSYQTLCLSAVLQAKFTVSAIPNKQLVETVTAIVQTYLEKDDQRQVINQIQNSVLNVEAPLVSTEDYAKLAVQLFSDAGQKYAEEGEGSENADSQERQSQEPSPNAKGASQGQEVGSPGSDGQPDGSNELKQLGGPMQGECGGAEAPKGGGADSNPRFPDDHPKVVDGGQVNVSSEAEPSQKLQSAVLSTTSGLAVPKSLEEDSNEKDGPMLLSDPADKASQEVTTALDDLLFPVTAGGAGGEAASVQDARQRFELDTAVDNRLVTAIMRCFQGTRQRSNALSSKGNSLSVRDAWRFTTLADPKVFKSQSTNVGMEMALTVLIDQSDSTRRILKDVCMSAVSFAVGLSRIQRTKCRIASFPQINGDGVTRTLLEFGMPYKQCLPAVEGLSAGGSTPMAQAIMAETSALQTRKESRKVIVVLTDGKPDIESAARISVQLAERQGVEVIGLGFGDAQKIKNWCENSEFVSTVDELADALTAVLAQKILLPA